MDVSLILSDDLTLHSYKVLSSYIQNVSMKTLQTGRHAHMQTLHWQREQSYEDCEIQTTARPKKFISGSQFKVVFLYN